MTIHAHPRYAIALLASSTPAALGARIKAETAQWAGLIREMGITAQ
jgi:hypothetical protein